MFFFSRKVVSRVRRSAAAIAVAVVVGAVPLASPVVSRALADSPSSAAMSGYWMVGSDGKVFPFGDAMDLGSPALPAGARATHIEPTPDGGGYYVLDDHGDVFSFGHTQPLGNAALAAGETAVSLSATSSGQGYWIFTSAGRVITKGDARNLGDMSGKHLNAPVVSSTVTPDGSGYWMVAGDGGVFSFGAPFWGSTGNLKLNKPVEGIVPTSTDKGYWLVASDGGVFAFGDAGFRGSMGATKLNKPVVGLVRYGDGYLMVASDGGIFAFSNLPFQGSLGSHPPANPIVGTASVPGAAGTGPSNGGGPTPAPGAGTTPTTAPTVVLPPGQLPQTVSINSRFSFGTPPDPTTVSSTKSGQELSQIVRAVVESGTDFYMSGQFTNLVDPSKTDPTGANSDGLPVSPAIPYLAQMDVNTGAPTAGSAFNAAVAPSCKSTTSVIPCRVSALAISPDGKTLYVGGNFDTIGGGKSPKLAAIDTATGLLDPAFKAPALTSEVEALVLRGNVLYTGGAFSSVQGTPRPGIAALDATTGGLIDSFVNQSGPTPLTAYDGHYSGQGGTPVAGPGNVHSIALTGDGSTLVVGGDFLNIGTTPLANPLAPTHGGIITLDASVTAAAPAGTGNLTTWQPTNPGSSHQRPAYQVTASPAGPKTFYAAEGGVGGEVVAWTVGNSSSGAPDWIQHVDGDGDGVAATSQRVYFGGHYGHVVSAAQQCTQVPCNVVGGTKSNQLAAFDLKGTFDNTWTAQADTPKGPDDLWIGPHGLYVGGGFFGVAPTPNPNGHNAYNNQPGLAIFPPAS
jgi:hypothetical protein